MDDAQRLLDSVGGNDARFGFRTFDEDKDRRDPGLTVTRHARFNDVEDELRRLNEAGAGVFFTVNALDGKGYRTENVTRVRAVFVDLDQGGRAALDVVLTSDIPPSMSIETSPDRFHCYWLVDGLPLDSFTEVQQALIDRFGGDPSVKDLPRVMRLPGFRHRKGASFISRIVDPAGDPMRYDGGKMVTDLGVGTGGSPRFDDAPNSQKPLDLDMFADALKAIPADDREAWRKVGMALKHHADKNEVDAEAAFTIWDDWSKTTGTGNYDAKDQRQHWDRDFGRRKGSKVVTAGTVFRLATEYGWRRPGRLTVDDFYCYMPMHNFIYAPTRDYWPGASVDKRVPRVPLPGGGSEAASQWIGQHHAVEQVTWYPGEPMVIEDRVIAEGGWLHIPGARCFNLYRPAPPVTGDPSKAGPWLEHVERLYPEEHDHIIKWFAHRVQRPGEKINHGVILGGSPGIGKDTLLVAIKAAIGYWNMREVSPVVLTESFNDWAKSVVLRVNEARDLGGNDMSHTNRYALYEHMKVLTAAPPEVLRVNEKHLRQCAVPNVVGLVITTNYPDGVYLPADDRRFFVAWSERTKGDFPEGYWTKIYGWLRGGGAKDVGAHLAGLDLSTFDPFAPPPWTQAKAVMVDQGADPDASKIADAIDAAKKPDALTLAELSAYGDEELEFMLTDRKNARRVPNLLRDSGYVRVVNPGDQSGKWKQDGKRVTIYARSDLPAPERMAAARRLTQ